MTVAEMIQWLQTQDEGATLCVLKRQTSYGYGGDWYAWVDFDPVEHSEYIDMRGNNYANGKPYENERTLYLGVN